MRFETGVRTTIVTIVAVALTIGAGGSVGAARGGNGRNSSGLAASASTYERCDFGAACDADASADRAGLHEVASSINQTTTTFESQSALGIGHGATTLVVAVPVPAVEITYTWRVDEATTTASAGLGDGRSVGRVFLRGLVSHTGCPGCVVEDPTDRHGIIVAESWAGGLGLFEDLGGPPAQAGPGEATQRIIVRGPNGGLVPAGKLEVSGSTLAFVYVGCPIRHGQCMDQSIGHSGAATASATTQLLRITHAAPAVRPVAA